MNAVQILKKAKQLLAKNHQETGEKEIFICHALDKACGVHNSNHSHEVLEEIKGVIKFRMSYELTLEDWLEKYHGINQISYSFPWVTDIQKKLEDYDDKVQATRHAWIDSLIVEFSAETVDLKSF